MTESGDKHHKKVFVSPKLRRAIRECCKGMQETKWFYPSNSITPGTTASVQSLVVSTQGTTDGTRVGDTIDVQWVNINGTIAMNTANTTFDCVRFILFVDTQPNGAITTAATVLNSPTVAESLYASQNVGKFKRIHIIKDMRFCMQSGGGQQRCFRIAVPVKRRVFFNGNAGSNADLVRNNICVLVVANENTNKSTVTYYTQVFYKDG